MRNRHSQKSTLSRSVKNPCPIKTSMVHEPVGVGVVDLGSWNYKDLPEDHPERIRIEKLFDTNKLPEKPNVLGKWRNER